ncbi:MAG TPA: universal stress protein [Pseudogracilibacillus sp.]|nr:universal stress protein [Pseudogracilibacillus sp.]
MDAEYEVILTPVDGSEFAKKAFQKAVRMAKLNNAKLVLAHIIESPSPAMVKQYDQHLIDQTKKDTQEILDEYVKVAKEEGLQDVESVVKFGKTKVEISETLAAAYQADLIIVGAKGKSAIERMLIGSVSEYIMRHAEIDVLIAR